MWDWSSQVSPPLPPPSLQRCYWWVFAGTRIGQASECFVYWKDPSTSDTWGLNFTSPIDAKQFRECCDGSRSNSSTRMRIKAASSRSTPASPSRSREPQCTCSHPDTLTAAAGTAGKQRQSGAQEAAGHRMRGRWSQAQAELNTHFFIFWFQGVKKQQSFESYLDSEGNKKAGHGISNSYQGRTNKWLHSLSVYKYNLCKSNLPTYFIFLPPWLSSMFCTLSAPLSLRNLKN